MAKARRAWASQAAFLKRFVAARGRVAAGTGFEFGGYPVPGAGLHRELAALVRAHNVDEVVFAYSDVTHETVMHLASRALAAGAGAGCAAGAAWERGADWMRVWRSRKAGE